MKVLVIGASGFIGLPVARAFTRAGHTVYGLTRSSEKAVKLAAEEITPVVAEPSDTSSWIHLIAKVDAVVDAVGGYEIQATSVKILDAVAAASVQIRPAGSAKIAYIYTSGTWVHGDNRTEVLTDTSPIIDPVALVAWRPAVEQLVVTNPVVNGVVVRPSMVYGYSGSILGMMFARASTGKVTWFGKPGARQAFIHADDLADMYLKAAEKAPVVTGLIFDAANDFSEGVDEILEKLVEVSGAEGTYEYVEPTNAFEAACAASAILRPYLARTLLGWQPRKPGVLDSFSVYYGAWSASTGLGTKN